MEGSSVGSGIPKHELEYPPIEEIWILTAAEGECWCRSGRLANRCSALYDACYGRLNETHTYCEADEEDEDQSHDDLLLYETHKRSKS